MQNKIIILFLLISINGFGQISNIYPNPNALRTFSDLFPDNEQVICEAYINGKLTQYDLDKGDSIKRKGFVYLGHSNITYYNAVKNEWDYQHYLFAKDVYLGNNKWLSESQSKPDTVKGWVRYLLLKDAGFYGAVNVAGEDTVNNKILFHVARPAIAIYDGRNKNASQLTLRIFDDSKPHPYDPEHGYLLKIIYRNGMEFDLSKWHEFIKDEEVVK